MKSTYAGKSKLSTVTLVKEDGDLEDLGAELSARAEAAQSAPYWRS